MNNQEANIDGQYQTFLVIWIALLISQVMFVVIIFIVRPELFQFDLSRPILGSDGDGEAGPVVVIGFAIAAVTAALLSFVFRRRSNERAIARQSVADLQSGLINEDTDLGYAEAVAELCQEKLKALDELPSFAYFFFKEDYPIDAQAQSKLALKQDIQARIRESVEVLQALETLTPAKLEIALKALAEAKQVPLAQYMTSLRLALSGKDVGPAFYPLLSILGKEKVIQRLERYLETIDP